MSDDSKGSVKRDGSDIVIRIPAGDAHSLCVALEACPCKATKSLATADIRERLKSAITRALYGRAA